MPKQFLLAAAASSLGALSLGACQFSADTDNAPAIQRAYTVLGFTGLEVAGPYEVVVHSGSTVAVRASGSEKAIERMKVEVQDGVLTIQSEKKGWNWGWGRSDAGPVTLDITVPALTAASIAGSGGISIDKVTGASFKGEIAGSGDLTLTSVDAGELALSIAGSGGIKAVGKATKVNYEIAGSGDIDAAKLTAQTASVSIAGSGGIRGHATGTAAIEIAGSGDVDLTGGAKCSVSKSGSGDVRCS